MKRLLSVVLIVLALSACDSASAPQKGISEQDRFSGAPSITEISVITDNQTGCKYVFLNSVSGGGLSPLYNDKGEIDCSK